MGYYGVKLALVIILIFALTISGLSAVSHKMRQITRYEGPTILEAFKEGINQGLSTGKATMDYLIDKAKVIK
ncbi:MAG TPA: hypothetical protein PLJ33_07370 [Peptococcaceae bacterium]|jgi:hypothetical protein|nr:hypothetical protein [Clostridia bacterium]HOB82586.1 hypothetical protein [Peptococcaceae bacterium]HPZ72164.1 hypothetical protein [Peptococcaceae bacterium]HQD54655.1 hypothetical protein [Peptococcaceae bacterium]